VEKEKADADSSSLAFAPLGFARCEYLFVRALRAFGQCKRDYYVIRVFGGEGVTALNLCAERGQQGDSAFVVKRFYTEGIRCAAQRTAKAVKRQVSLGQHLSTRLKITQRIEHKAFVVGDLFCARFVEECGLAHPV
jgi:hypothetical protein